MGIILKHSFRRYKSMVGAGGGVGSARRGEGGGAGCLHTLYICCSYRLLDTAMLDISPNK